MTFCAARNLTAAAFLVVCALSGCNPPSGSSEGKGAREERVTGSPSDGARKELAARLREHVEALSGGPARTWLHPEVLAVVSDRIEAFWREQGYRTERMPIPDMAPSYINVLAFPPGVTWSDKPYILGAHYDAVQGTPGADDNASGVAVMLEVSRLLTAGRAPAPVVFAAFTLEEPPFFQTPQQGSRVLVDSLRSRSTRIRGGVILEMVGYYRREPDSQAFPFPLGYLGYSDTGNFCGIIANWRSRKMVGPLKRAISGADLPVESLVVPGKGGLLEPVRLSDHASFWDHGYPAVMLTDTSFYRNPYYHGPGDTPDTLDYDSMARLTIGLADFFRGNRAADP